MFFCPRFHEKTALRGRTIAFCPPRSMSLGAGTIICLGPAPGKTVLQLCNGAGLPPLFRTCARIYGPAPSERDLHQKKEIPRYEKGQLSIAAQSRMAASLRTA